jgi:pimeloyl-ACP methyl ester carboxylesterase
MLRYLTAGLIIIGLLLAACQDITNDKDALEVEVAAVETVSCPFDMPATETEGQTIECGRIEVPQVWELPEEESVAINYAILLAHGENPLPDPIFYFEGGPGSSALGEVAVYAEAFDHLRSDRDIILWDQRGNLYSGHLSCPDEVRDPRFAVSEEDAVATIEAAGPPPTVDPALLEPPALDDDPQIVLENERELKAAVDSNTPEANCRSYYEANGIVPEAYDTRASVKDAIALMAGLAYDAYNLYGISYGTTVALETMRYYDEADNETLPTVRSVLIDGVSPLYVPMAEQGLIRPYNVRRNLAACAADPACEGAYPGLHSRLEVLLATAEDAPLILNDGRELGLHGLRQAVISAANDDDGLWPYLPRMIAELEQGETAVLDRLDERAAQPVMAAVELFDTFTLDVADFVTCNDRSANLDIERSFDILRQFPLPQLVTALQIEVEQLLKCEAWILQDTPAPLPDPVTADIPTFVSNGGMDSATAPEWGEVAATGLPNAVTVTFPLSFHGASLQSDCARSVARALINDPLTSPDLSCVSEMQPAFAMPDDALPPVHTRASGS